MIDCENIIIHNNEAVNNILKVTMHKAYYNEIDPYAAEWLRNLITAGHIAPGEVDTRSIVDVKPNDLAGFNQCHFFAGIGVWSYALRRAGWPDSRSVWTGSCPCQPFSSAGQGNGFSDERHLWPAWFHLISQRNPNVIFGEQVASKDADAWIDLVQADLESLGYAVGAVPFPSAGVGAPHIRDRLYWLADATSWDPEQFKGEWSGPGTTQSAGASSRLTGRGNIGVVGVTHDAGLERLRGGYQTEGGRFGTVRPATETSEFSRLADTASNGHFTAERPAHIRRVEQQQGRQNRADERFESEAKRRAEFGGVERASTGPINGFWRDSDWLGCRDGKFRPVEPSTFPLVNGAASRVGRLRAYGNAINAQAAIAFIESYLECQPCQ